jgi:AcrR family transcriptional regulator
VGRGKKIVDIELVIDEAIALIEEGGVEEFSTRRLASRLGISAMTLYNYYENRGAILKGAFEKGSSMLWSGLQEEIEARRAPGDNGHGAFQALSEHLLAFATTRPKLCHFILTVGAGEDWAVRDGWLDTFDTPQGLPPGGGRHGAAKAARKRAVYLFELIIYALALKVIGGAESPERYRDLAAEGLDRLLESREDG